MMKAAGGCIDLVYHRESMQPSAAFFTLWPLGYYFKSYLWTNKTKFDLQTMMKAAGGCIDFVYYRKSTQPCQMLLAIVSAMGINNYPAHSVTTPSQ